MKNFKRTVALMLCILMVIPAMSFSASAYEADGWTYLAAKFSSKTCDIIYGSESTSPRADGFTFETNANGGIDVHTATPDEVPGVYGVSVLTNSNKTVLDNLNVVITPGETFSAQRDSNAYSDRLSVMFSTSPVTKIAEKGVSGGITDSIAVGTNGIRYLMPSTGNTVVVSVNNTYAQYTSQVESDVAIVTYDGVFKDAKDGHPGYRWVFTGEDNGERVVTEFPRIDVSRGLVFEFVPDTTLGYKVTVNGAEFYKGTAVRYFPNDATGSFEKARANVNLSQFCDEEGYLTIAGCANLDCTLDYTVEKINGVNAAQWKGEASSHTHNYKKKTKAATCTTDGYTYCECSCGAHYVCDNTAASGHEWALNPDRTFRDWGYTVTDRYWSKVSSSAGAKKYAYVTYPTCTENGVNHKVCVVCGATEDDILPALKHEAIYTRMEDTQNGQNKIYYANRWSDWYITTPATATTAGVKERKCLLCGETETMSYTKYDDTEEINSKWYVSGETTISRSNGYITGNATKTVVNTDGKRTYTTLNNDGSITVLDEAAKTGVLNASTTYNNITKLTSRAQSKLNNFEATVQMVPVNGIYADSVNFCLTNQFDNYCYAGEFGGGSYTKLVNTTLEDSRIGYLWDRYLPGEYSFTVTLMDGLVLWSTYTYGTMNDQIYDVAFYASICRGDLWNIKYYTTAMNTETYDYENLEIDPSEPITFKTNYQYDEDEDIVDLPSFTVNGKVMFAGDFIASQSYDQIYYFSVGAFAANAGKRPAAFTLIDVCGEKPMEYDGFDDPEGCDHEWGEYVWEQKTVTRNVGGKDKKVRINIEPSCTSKGYKVSTCESCGCTQKQVVAPTGHTFSDWSVIVEPSCTMDGLKVRTCQVWSLDDDGVNQPCGEMEYAIIEGGHVWNDWDEVTPASCTQDGLRRRTCSECTAFEEEVITAPGHQWGEWDTVTPVSCTANGLKRRTCTKCTNGVEEEVINATDHVWGEWVADTSTGKETRKCTKCTAEETRDIATENPFTDVPADSWFTTAALWCNSKGYITGTTKTTFSPDVALSRAMFVVILAKVDGVNLDGVTYGGKFTDVPDNQWYTKAVQWAVDCGVTSGTSATTFGPNVTVTREQLSTFFFAYAKYKKYDVSATVSLAKYTDEKDISGWAKNAVVWAVAEGLISGTSATTVSPKVNATRNQAAVIFKSFVENYIAKQK